MDEAIASLRLDKWLWHARFAKTRSVAAKLCAGGDVTVGGHRAMKPHHAVRIGDIVTIRLGRSSRQVEVLALGERRGPAVEAQRLYRETQPAAPVAREEWVPLLTED